MQAGESVTGPDNGVLEALVDEVLKLPGSAPKVSVEDVRVGVFYTGVKLSSGHAGIAYTPSEELPLEHAKRHAYMPKAGKLRGLPVDEAARLVFSDNLLEAAFGLATVNALAELHYAAGWPGCREVRDADALDLLEVKDADTVTMVGAFPYFIRQLRGKVKALHVTERNPEAFIGYPLVPAERQSEVLDVADVVLITAEALVNHTLDGILPLCRRARAVALVGPTTPLCPGPLFDHGVTLVAGTHLPDADAALGIVGEGGTGGHLWAAGAVKVNLLRA